MRTLVMLLPVGMVIGGPVGAQVDPGTVAQGQVLSATARGYAERDAARLRGGVPRKGTAQLRRERECANLWKMRSRMTRAQRQRLYDQCPR